MYIYIHISIYFLKHTWGTVWSINRNRKFLISSDIKRRDHLSDFNLNDFNVKSAKNSILGSFSPPSPSSGPMFSSNPIHSQTTNEVQNHIVASLSECSFLHFYIRNKIFIFEPYYVLMQDAYLIFKRFLEGLNSQAMHLHEILYKMKYSLTYKLYELRQKYTTYHDRQ